MTELTLCANCNEEAEGSPAKVTFEGGYSAEGEPAGRQVFRTPLCSECAAAVARFDFAGYGRRRENRRRELELP